MPLVTIPRDQIRGVRLLHGRISEHPLVLLLVAVLCLAAGVFGAGLLLRSEQFPKTAALSLSLVIPIPWVIAAALRRGPTLVVDTLRGTRKLGFGSDVRIDQLSAFVEQAREQAAMEIVAELPRAALSRR